MTLPRLIYILLSLCSRPLSYGEAAHYASLYADSSARWGLPVEVVVATAIYENHACDPGAVSRTNDVGLMQIHTQGGRALAIYQDPAWNIERGCEVLWAARRRRCWGRREPSRGACLAAWLQGYNPGSEGYGRRVAWMVRRVEAAGREWDESVEGLREGVVGALTEWIPWLGAKVRNDG